MTPVFVKPTTFARSYTDYYELVRLSGHECLPVESVPWGSTTTVVITTLQDSLSAPIKRSAKCILWLLERPGTCPAWPRLLELAQTRRMDIIWLSDRALAQKTGLVFVPVGSDKGLGTPSTEKEYDFIHLCYCAPRSRRTFLEAMSNTALNGWGEVRHEALRRSRFMLNVHQDDELWYEPLRFALAAAYGLPLVSEICADPFPWRRGIDLLEVPVNKLRMVAEAACRDPYEWWREKGLATREYICQNWRFGDNVARAAEGYTWMS